MWYLINPALKAPSGTQDVGPIHPIKEDGHQVPVKVLQGFLKIVYDPYMMVVDDKVALAAEYVTEIRKIYRNSQTTLGYYLNEHNGVVERI